MLPLSEPDAAPGVTLSRLSLDKQFHGDLLAVGIEVPVDRGTNQGMRDLVEDGLVWCNRTA